MEQTDTTDEFKLLIKQEIPSVPQTPTKLRRRKKLRRLADNSDENDKKPEEPHKDKHRKHIKLLLIGLPVLTLFVSVLVGHYYSHGYHKSALKNFVKSYRKQYNQILHGQRDYCDMPLNTSALFQQISQHNILNQNEALQQLEMALHNNNKHNSIAIVGVSGVGKSLFTRALIQHFPWRENVHTYAWNTYVNDEAQKFRILRLFVENLSECGLNLLIIENLAPCDHQVVAILNQLIAEHGDAASIRVVVIYVFNLNSMEQIAVYKRKYEALQKLSEAQTINFKSFGSKELKDCIQRECQLEHIKLNADDFNEIVATLDATRSGCKNVHAKVLLYAHKNLQDLL